MWAEGAGNQQWKAAFCRCLCLLPSTWLRGNQLAEYVPAAAEASRAAADACHLQNSCDVASIWFQLTCLEHTILMSQ